MAGYHGANALGLSACTNLADKATMIWKEKFIVSATRTDLLGFYQKPQAIRNKCAHPGEHGALLPKGDLASFVISALKMRNILSEAMKTHGAYDHRQVDLRDWVADHFDIQAADDDQPSGSKHRSATRGTLISAT